MSRSPAPKRHKKEKKKDKDKEKTRDERERSTSKKKKSKDKEKDRERKSESDKDVKVTRDYDEEEQGYDSEKEKKEEKADEPASPKLKESPSEKGSGDARESKVNGDDHHEEDMDERLRIALAVKTVDNRHQCHSCVILLCCTCLTFYARCTQLLTITGCKAPDIK